MICGEAAPSVSRVSISDGGQMWPAYIETSSRCFFANDLPGPDSDKTYTIRASSSSGSSGSVAMAVRRCPLSLSFGYNRSPGTIDGFNQRDTYDAVIAGNDASVLSSVSVNGKAGVWNNENSSWIVKEFDLNTGCSPPILMVASYGGNTLYATGNPERGFDFIRNGFGYSEYLAQTVNDLSGNRLRFEDYGDAGSWNRETGGSRSEHGYGTFNIPPYPWTGTVVIDSTYDRFNVKTSCSASGFDKTVYPTFEAALCARRTFVGPSYLYANVSPDYVYYDELRNEEEIYEGEYGSASPIDFRAGGRPGTRDPVYWFRLKGYDCYMDRSIVEGTPQTPAVATRISLFGQPLYIPLPDPNNPNDTSYRYTGDLLKSFNKFQVADATPFLKVT